MRLVDRISARGRLHVAQALAVASVLGGVLAAPHAAVAQSAVQIVNQELLTITQQTSGMLIAGPPDVALQMAIVDNAMFDAVNAATGSQYKSYAYAGGPVSGASADAAALAAGYTALQAIFNQPMWTSASINTGNSPITGGSNAALINNVVLPGLTTSYNNAMTAIGAESGLAAGTTLGVNAANAVLASPAGVSATSPTGAAAMAMQAGTSFSTYSPPAGSTPGTTPGVYVQPGGRPAMYPTWGASVTPVGATSAQLSTAEQTATLAGVSTTTTDPTVAAGLVQTSIATSAYATDLLTTECQGSGVTSAAITAACTAVGLTPQTVAQAQAALFWNDPGSTIQPPGHWLQMVDTAISTDTTPLSLIQQARLSAGVSTAMADAGIAAWGDKYIYDLWRPVTAIAKCSTTSGYTWNTTGLLTAATCDPTWSSLIATPPHPDFVAGHPAFSGAAATVLADFFGTDNIAAALGVSGLSSVSNAYCNGGTPGYALDGITIISCTVTTATPSYGVGVYTTCNAISTDTNSADASVAALSINSGNGNNSPLICGITENYASFSAASDGPLGSEFSRIAGGIHTPTAVVDALYIGNSIGAADFANNFQPVPEPAMLALFGLAGIGVITVTRRRTGAR